MVFKFHPLQAMTVSTKFHSYDHSVGLLHSIYTIYSVDFIIYIMDITYCVLKAALHQLSYILSQ